MRGRQWRRDVIQWLSMAEILKPGQWLDDLPEPLHTAADVADLMERVERRKAELLAEAIEKASRN